MTAFAQSITRRTVLQGASALAGVAVFGFGLKQTVFAHNDATPAADPYPKSAYTGKEYAIEGPVSLNAGFNEITFTNNGTMDHHAMFLKLNDGKTVADLATVKDLPGLFAVASGAGGPGSIAPNESTTVIIDLAAGNYVVACIIPGDDGVPHMAKGMALPVTVTAVDGAAALSEPEADAVFELAEYGFPDFPKSVVAGEHIWKITNAGAQLHEIVLYRIAKGVSTDDVLAGLGIGADSMPGMDMSTPAPAATATGEPPTVGVAGVAPISPKGTNWLKIDLEKADYLALCFIPDSESGAPHFTLGMAMPFTVS